MNNPVLFSRIMGSGIVPSRQVQVKNEFFIWLSSMNVMKPAPVPDPGISSFRRLVNHLPVQPHFPDDIGKFIKLDRFYDITVHPEVIGLNNIPVLTG